MVEKISMWFINGTQRTAPMALDGLLDLASFDSLPNFPDVLPEEVVRGFVGFDFTTRELVSAAEASGLHSTLSSMSIHSSVSLSVHMYQSDSLSVCPFSSLDPVLGPFLACVIQFIQAQLCSCCRTACGRCVGTPKRTTREAWCLGRLRGRCRGGAHPNLHHAVPIASTTKLWQAFGWNRTHCGPWGTKGGCSSLSEWAF